MAGENTLQTLNGLAKEVYADGIVDLIPKGTKLQQKINFISKEKEHGNAYHQPVLLAYEQGFTFGDPSTDGAFALNAAAAGVMKDASVPSYEMLLRAKMAYSIASRAAKGRNSFIDATKLLFESMQKSMRKKVECQLFYGGKGIGTVASLSSATVTITTAEWASGIWAGAEGMKIEVYNAALSTNRGSANVVSVDIDARTVTLDAAPAGTTSTDVLFFYGAKGKEMNGVHSILSNSSSMFGISAATYTLWKASTHAVGATDLTQDIVGKGIAKAVARGLDEELDLLINPLTWNKLLSSQAALRNYVEDSAKQSGKKVKMVNGADTIEFHSQNGIIRIEPSIYVKEGYGFGLVTDSWKRLGSTDVTFNTPGGEGEIFFHLPDNAGFEVRCYTDQSLFCEAPGKNLLLTGIVNG